MVLRLKVGIIACITFLVSWGGHAAVGFKSMKHGAVGERVGREKTDGSAICPKEKSKKKLKKIISLGVGGHEGAQFMIDAKC